MLVVVVAAAAGIKALSLEEGDHSSDHGYAVILKICARLELADANLHSAQKIKLKHKSQEKELEVA